MGEDERVRFEEMEKRLAAADKRFDDMRWFVGGGTGVFAIFISAFTIFLGLNLSSEKASIRDFVQDAKTQLGLLAPNADIKILGTNGAPLDGQEMVATFRSQKENNETKIWLQVRAHP
jgi:hypothetical protein